FIQASASTAIEGTVLVDRVEPSLGCFARDLKLFLF
ncbi:hypothetical protein A2U01_0087385, partial [Trifolium medium]|nr:hypothetical protein [Trifolium medium]